VYFVYVIKSLKVSNKYYVGFTKDLQDRLKSHNAGQSLFSRKYSPWELDSYVCFTSEVKARFFERYLKSGSGHAFFRKYLV
jgi:predicted GIY-YIG superfamily endonuclease